MFIIAFTTARHLSLFWGRLIHSMLLLHFLKTHFNIILHSANESSKLSTFLSFPLKPCMHICSLPYMLHALPVSLFFIWSPELYLVRSIEHDAPRYVVFSIFLLHGSSYAQISSSVPYSRQPSAYVSPLMWTIKFLIHAKQQEKL
jgi:hypothetical protein